MASAPHSRSAWGLRPGQKTECQDGFASDINPLDAGGLKAAAAVADLSPAAVDASGRLVGTVSRFEGRRSARGYSAGPGPDRCRDLLKACRRLECCSGGQMASWELGVRFGLVLGEGLERVFDVVIVWISLKEAFAFT